MIKLQSLLPLREDTTEYPEGHGPAIDLDRLMWHDSYLDDIAEELGYNNDFTKVFWSQHHIPTLFHCTTKERYKQIKVEGLKLKDENRGATSGNSAVGPAVFTTAEDAEVSFFKSYYGPIVIAIDAAQMKKDGFMPEVSKEPDWEKAEKLEFVLRKLGQEDVEASRFVDSSDQNTQGTVIVYSDIPPRYLSLVEYD